MNMQYYKNTETFAKSTFITVSQRS